MLRLLLLLLVGTVIAEKSDNCPQDHQEEQIVAGIGEDKCDMPEVIESTPLSDCTMEKCQDVSLDGTRVDLKGGMKHSHKCRNKGTCFYGIISSPSTFVQAQEYCRGQRGSLTSIHGSWVNSYVRIKARATLLLTGFGYLWIGVYANCNSKHYVNVDGSTLDYTNWAYGQPNTCGTWCTALKVSDGKWYTFNCRDQLPFVCTY